MHINRGRRLAAAGADGVGDIPDELAQALAAAVPVPPGDFHVIGGLTQPKKKRLKAGDILVTRTGYPGIACVVPKKYEGCQTFTTLIVRLRDDSPVTAEYVSQLINSPIGKEFVGRFKVGSSQQNFGATALKMMPIGIPPLALQQEFAAFVAEVDKSRFNLLKAYGSIIALFRVLFP